MMEYSNDIQERTALLRASVDRGKTSDPTLLLSQLTRKTEDSYLMARAAAIADAAVRDDEFRSAVRIFAAQCHPVSQDCVDCPLRKYGNAYMSFAQSTWDPSAPKMIDLFCGAGGLSLGFTQEGFLTGLANDIDPCCIDT